MAKIERVREALTSDDAAAIAAATEGYPRCADAPPVAVLKDQKGARETGCLREIADALGSKRGFVAPHGDNASATAVAIVLVREGRGDFVVHADWWLPIMKEQGGSGADALRLATARRMAEAAPLVGRRIEEEKDARDAMKAIASAIPGACPTYWLLGTGAVDKTLPPALTADHAACVHADLKRREGPGPSYGEGIFRALEGALALWRETERSLRLGVAKAGSPAIKATLEKKLGVIEQATQKIATKKLESTQSSATLERLGDLHAEAGVILWKPKDAGADAAK
jgi:hypothetical protein